MEEIKKRYPRLWFWGLCALAFILTAPICGLGDYGIEVRGAPYKTLCFVGAALFCAAEFFAVRGTVRAYKALEKPIKANTLAFALIAALQAYELSETCIAAMIFKSHIMYNLMGYIMYAVPFLLGVVIFKRPKVWFCIWEVLFGIYSVAQYYITQFRGSPIKFTDLSNLRSAMEIKSEYKLTPSFIVAAALVQVAAMMFITIKTELVTEKVRMRLIPLGGAAAAAAVFMLGITPTYDYGIKNRIICLNFSGAEETRTARHVGSLLMFCYDGVYNHVKVPEGYSTEKAESIIAQYTQAEPDGSTPIVIGILNESFADFSLIGDFETNEDVIPVWHSLEKNTLKGYVTVSSYGGYSCNSEYEYLSGNSMQFLPLGSAVYTNYLDSKQDSLVTVFNDLGFETVALTPCRPGLWNIDQAYEYLDFKTKYFRDTINLSSDLTYNGQPADSVLFKKICDLADRRDKSKGLFFWVTTMQNHAPYSEDVPGGIQLKSMKDVQAERYLNSIHLSDRALGELIDHFKDYDERVVIVMFGDHYPHLPDFAENLYGSPLADLDVENYSRIHQTPFLVWCNRDIPSGFTKDISLNYLNIETMKAAGLPLTPIQQELEHIRESLPVVSGFGYKTSDGIWHQTGDDPGSCKDIMTEYQTLQYYRMFDENRKILKGNTA